MRDQLAYYRELLEQEITQRREEGCEVTEASQRLGNVNDLSAAQALYADLLALPAATDAHEPSTLAAIQAARPAVPQLLPPSDTALVRDKILGGWLGRCAGCQLGKPVEGWSYAQICDYLAGAGLIQIDDYLPERSVDAAGNLWQPPDWGLPATREHISRANRDDDQDYTIIGLHIIERYGPDFRSADVGATWLRTLPYHQVYTAERQAYRNLIEGYAPVETALRWNPYREWIGAQIRADIWGYVAPGQPERAAAFAFQDAALSHVKNGIYGAMFFAALIASAFASDDIELCIRSAASQIPRNSRFAAMVADCLHWAQVFPRWEEARAQLAQRYGHYHWVHTINNAGLVLLALLYGRGDYGRTIGYAVQGGWDTDCNGATAGSIIGVLHGAAALPDRWISPLHDTLESAVFGFGTQSISALAERTWRLVGE